MVWFTSKIGCWSESYDGLQSKLFTEYCSNPVYMNINTGSVAIEFIRYNSQLLVQHLYVFPWGLIDRFVGASQHNVKKRVHTGYCNLFHFANDIVHYKQKMNLYTAESDVFFRMFAKYFLCSLSTWNLIMNLLVKISYQFKLGFSLNGNIFLGTVLPRLDLNAWHIVLL